MAASARTFTTGLEFLDRRLDGGIGVGRLLALTAPPSSQTELLLRQLASTRRTTFVSTHRSAAEVREWAAAGVEIDVTRVTPEELLQGPDAVLESLTSESFLILDTADGLEHAPRESYLDLLDQIKQRLVETDSVGVLHCTDRADNPPRRALTLSRADTVWQVELLVLSREIKTRLLVTKSRSGRALSEPIPLLITDQVRIDTSQRIS